MSNYDDVVKIIKSVSGQENTLGIPRIYMQLLDGDASAAIFLSQCVFWSDKTRNPNGFYRSYAEWEEKTGLKRGRVQRGAKKCSQWVTVSLHRANGAPTLHYLVDIDAVTKSVMDFLICGKPANGFAENEQMDLRETRKSDLRETSKSLTEITQREETETTTNDLPVCGVSSEADKLGNVFKSYQDNINCAITPIEKDTLTDWAKEFPVAWIEDAIKVAVKNNVRRLNYVHGVLKRWKRDGYQPDKNGSAGGAPRSEVKQDKDGGMYV